MTLLQRILSIFRRRRKRSGASCHSGGAGPISGKGLRKLAIVGNPNVGKSVVFNQLTGRYVTISNYPGTTVDVSRGKAILDGCPFEVVDTPGMYIMHSITEEERVARKILLDEKPDVILHVVDARNLPRMLPLTLQLIEAGLPVVLELNMMDEAEAAGIDIDTSRLSRRLGIPVVATVAVSGRGLDVLRRTLARAVAAPGNQIKYDKGLEEALAGLSRLLRTGYGLTNRAIGLLLLQGDTQIESQVKKQEGARWDEIRAAVASARADYSQPLSYVIALRQQEEVKGILNEALTKTEKGRRRFADWLSTAMMNPYSGSLIFAAIIYVGLYWFVGVFGAGTMVDFIESTIFGQWINPWVTSVAESIIPWQVVRDLFVGEYGVITLGLTYAFAIILPIVGTFFIVFSIIEDSGYLPRLAMLIDRIFKLIGLNGRAVIPIVLGFGCDTMATIVTRTQETRRERLLTTLLLALAIPCSAQLGVIFGILSGSAAALLIWMGTLIFVFLLIGYLASRIIPGQRASFYMEVPPLRLPKLSNVITKTYTRLEWYFTEVLPFFLLASVFLWLGKLTGLFDIVIGWLTPVVEFIGIPGDAAVAFLYGFFRRDFGAAGLYDLNNAGILVGIPLVVAAVTITLFVPCIAQFLVMAKERGWKTAISIALFILPFAFLVGYILNLILTSTGVTL
ncbi:MAG: ferrous iron transport protein B [Dehalococcoidales bacterium]